MAAAPKLMTLLPDLRAIIVRNLPQATARSLAATTSAALRDVLEARSDLKSFSLRRTLARRMAQLTFSAAGNPRSRADVRCTLHSVLLHIYIPLHAVPQVCADQTHKNTQTKSHSESKHICGG